MLAGRIWVLDQIYVLLVGTAASGFNPRRVPPTVSQVYPHAYCYTKKLKTLGGYPLCVPCQLIQEDSFQPRNGMHCIVEFRGT